MSQIFLFSDLKITKIGIKHNFRVVSSSIVLVFRKFFTFTFVFASITLESVKNHSKNFSQTLIKLGMRDPIFVQRVHKVVPVSQVFSKTYLKTSQFFLSFFIHLTFFIRLIGCQLKGGQLKNRTGFPEFLHLNIYFCLDQSKISQK